MITYPKKLSGLFSRITKRRVDALRRKATGKRYFIYFTFMMQLIG
jgi:hypothetical protein